MKLKLVVIDFELSTRAKCVLAAIAVPALLLGGGAVAYANVPHTWTAGDTLKAADLNDNFSKLDDNFSKVDQRVTAVEQAQGKSGQQIESLSDTPESGVFGQDYVYTAAGVTLTPGTWLVVAHASIYSTGQIDQLQLGLYDATNSADVPGSKSGLAKPTVVNVPLGLSTSKVIAISSNTLIQMKGYRNGASVLNFGTGESGIFLTDRERIVAVELK